MTLSHYMWHQSWVLLKFKVNYLPNNPASRPSRPKETVKTKMVKAVRQYTCNNWCTDLLPLIPHEHVPKSHVITCDDMWFWNMSMWNFCKGLVWRNINKQKIFYTYHLVLVILALHDKRLLQSPSLLSPLCKELLTKLKGFQNRKFHNVINIY